MLATPLIPTPSQVIDTDPNVQPRTSAAAPALAAAASPARQAAGGNDAASARQGIVGMLAQRGDVFRPFRQRVQGQLNDGHVRVRIKVRGRSTSRGRGPMIVIEPPAAALNHPNVCTVFDLGSHADRQFIVMELLEGEPLAQRIAGRRLDLPLLLEVGIGIADGLAAAHAAGIVHRDVKPANVHVSSHGQIKLLDFGLAKTAALADSLAAARVGALTEAGTFMGTVAYMSPEQARGEEVDARTDLFSFGAVLFEMATGKLPFAGTTPATMLDAILNKPPARLEGVHPELAQIIGKALEKPPAMRYQAAAEMGADLRRLKRNSEAGRARTEVAERRRTSRVRKRIESLAVLPLVNTTGDPDAEYLSESIAENLINSFSQLPKLRVAQQQKSFRYRGAAADLQQAANELRVQAILTGKVLLRGDTLIVGMGLVDVESDAHVWGQQYTKKMTDIFVLQDQITDEVLRALKVKLGSERKPKRQTRDTEAYHLYLKGRFYWGKRTPEHVQKAISLYQQALEKDPGYALAYAGLADCYALLGFTPYGAVRPADAFPRAKAAAQRALLFDPTLGEAHASLAACALLYEWDWAAAEREFREALRIAPGNVGARVWYSTLLAVLGRHEEGIREAQRSLEIDPLSVIAAAHVSLRFYNAGAYEKAVAAAKSAIAMDASYPSAYAYLAFAYQAVGDVARAVDAAETVASIMRRPHWTAYLGSLYGHANRREDARRILDELTRLSSRTYVSPFSLALVHAGLGDTENWRKCMHASLEERSGTLMYLECAALFDNMRSQPFYAELVRKVGLPSGAA